MMRRALASVALVAVASLICACASAATPTPLRPPATPSPVAPATSTQAPRTATPTAAPAVASDAATAAPTLSATLEATGTAAPTHTSAPKAAATVAAPAGETPAPSATGMAAATIAPAARTPAPTSVPTAPATALPTAKASQLWQLSTPEAEQRLSRYKNGIEGTLVERLFYSPALGRTMPYDIYLPPGYEKSDRRYPVLYVLHGGGGHRDEWPGYGFIDVADKEIREGRMQPMIIAFPQGDTGYWTDNADGAPRWGEYLWRDVVGHVDAAYRTLAAPESRAVGGNSMGGHGALSNSFLHPDVFSVAGSHGASLPEDNGFRPVLGTGDFFKQKDPVTLARTAPGIDKLKIWIDDALDDTWYPRNNELHNALAGRGIPHTWQASQGVHDFTYWMKQTPDYLRFYAQNLAGQ